MATDHPSSASAPGDTAFNAADRLAIINLFGTYAQSYDAGRLDTFRSLFTDQVELKYMNGSNVWRREWPSSPGS
jgi:hypothetical protein